MNSMKILSSARAFGVSSAVRSYSSSTALNSKVAVLGAAGGIGQPLSLLTYVPQAIVSKPFGRTHRTAPQSFHEAKQHQVDHHREYHPTFSTGYLSPTFGASQAAFAV